MKTPHDPLDDLLAADLVGNLTPEEKTALDKRLQNDPAVRAAYQETQLMHDLLEKTHREAQPDPAFEQRMISGVRRKIQSEAEHRETPWESVLVLWRGLRNLVGGSPLRRYAALAVLAVFLSGILVLGGRGTIHAARHSLLGDISTQDFLDSNVLPDKAKKLEVANDKQLATEQGPTGQLRAYAAKDEAESAPMEAAKAAAAQSQLLDAPRDEARAYAAQSLQQATHAVTSFPPAATSSADSSAGSAFRGAKHAQAEAREETLDEMQVVPNLAFAMPAPMGPINAPSMMPPPGTVVTSNGLKSDEGTVAKLTPTTSLAPVDNRKLIRNAQLGLEVKAYQAAIDRITALTKAAGGYVDTSNSQRGGNGKLQGNIVLKVLPQNLDNFLLQLRELGEIKNQSISTDDVTKAYYDTQARLDNSRRMEMQLQDLLKRDNGKVSELLQVERELGRVRGDIEQMQGELKLYDFQVQYATVTIALQEKDLSDAAAYLLKESDQFSLVATDVEATFQQARHAADDFKANILSADLHHDSDGVSATIAASVPPDQIDGFLARVRQLGRVQNFTRQTQRVARDGGETDRPANETLTEKDRVLVNLTIQSDNQSQKQATLTVVTSAVEQALEKAKTAALTTAGAEILSSSLNQNPSGRATGQLSVRVPGKRYPTLLATLRGLGRVSVFTLQRDDHSGPNASGDETPVTISLALTDDEAPLQRSDLEVSTSDVEAKAQLVKKDSAAAGVEVRSAGFDRQPDGSETAQMTFRLPIAEYPAFIDKLKTLGHVDSLTVHREDRADDAATDPQAPAEISFRLYSPGQIVSQANGPWAAIRRTFAEGAQALFSSVTMIGVILAFLAPWVLFLAVAVWVGRRIYIARRR